MMKLFTLIVFDLAIYFLVSRLDAGYKIEVKVEGGLKRVAPKSKINAALTGNYFHIFKH